MQKTILPSKKNLKVGDIIQLKTNWFQDEEGIYRRRFNRSFVEKDRILKGEDSIRFFLPTKPLNLCSRGFVLAKVKKLFILNSNAKGRTKIFFDVEILHQLNLPLQKIMNLLAA